MPTLCPGLSLCLESPGPGAHQLTQSPKSTVSLSQTHGDLSLAASALCLLSTGLVISTQLCGLSVPTWLPSSVRPSKQVPAEAFYPKSSHVTLLLRSAYSAHQ